MSTPTPLPTAIAGSAFTLRIFFVGLCGYVPKGLNGTSNQCNSLYVLLVNALNTGKQRERTGTRYHLPHIPALCFGKDSIGSNDSEARLKNLSLHEYRDADYMHEKVNRRVYLQSGLLEIELVNNPADGTGSQPLSGTNSLDGEFHKVPKTEVFLNGILNGLSVKDDFLTKNPLSLPDLPNDPKHLFSRIELKGGSISGGFSKMVKFRNDSYKPANAQVVYRKTFTVGDGYNGIKVRNKIDGTHYDTINFDFCLKPQLYTLPGGGTANFLDLYIMNEAAGPVKPETEDTDFELIYKLTIEERLRDIETAYGKLIFPSEQQPSSPLPPGIITFAAAASPKPILCFGAVFNKVP